MILIPGRGSPFSSTTTPLIRFRPSCHTRSTSSLCKVETAAAIVGNGIIRQTDQQTNEWAHPANMLVVGIKLLFFFITLLSVLSYLHIHVFSWYHCHYDGLCQPHVGRFILKATIYNPHFKAQQVCIWKDSALTYYQNDNRIKRKESLSLHFPNKTDKAARTGSAHDGQVNQQPKMSLSYDKFLKKDTITNKN